MFSWLNLIVIKCFYSKECVNRKKPPPQKKRGACRFGKWARPSTHTHQRTAWHRSKGRSKDLVTSSQVGCHMASEEASPMLSLGALPPSTSFTATSWVLWESQLSQTPPAYCLPAGAWQGFRFNSYKGQGNIHKMALPLDASWMLEVFPKHSSITDKLEGPRELSGRWQISCYALLQGTGPDRLIQEIAEGVKKSTAGTRCRFFGTSVN